MTIPSITGSVVKQILVSQFKSDQIVLDAQSYSEWQINNPAVVNAFGLLSALICLFISNECNFFVPIILQQCE